MNEWVMFGSCSLVAAACWTDLRAMRIPNVLTGGFAAAGVLVHAAAGGWSGIAPAFAGAAAGMLPLLALYRLRGIGGGDVKWFGAFGVWNGAIPTLQLLVYSILLAGVFSAALLLLRLPGLSVWGRRLPWPWGTHPVTAGKGASFPFMLAVLPGFAWQLWSIDFPFV